MSIAIIYLKPTESSADAVFSLFNYLYYEEKKQVLILISHGNINTV